MPSKRASRVATGPIRRCPQRRLWVSVRAQLNGVDRQIAGLQPRSTWQPHGKMDQLMKRVESTPQVERWHQVLTRDLELARTNIRRAAEEPHGRRAH